MTVMMTNPLQDIAQWPARRRIRGIPSICTAHPDVIAAAMRHYLDNDMPLLIEATCNQVNQEGGYTGMTPAGFRDFVEGIALRLGFPTGRLILGGDHLGPNPWKSFAAEEAMERACRMVADYAAAGFTKLHLDCSMRCADDPPVLEDALIAARAARLAGAAESHLPGGGDALPAYIIGTEVPIPGGAMEEIEALEITRPEAALATFAVHERAFAKLGLQAAFDRVIGLVVQPGVEFGNHNVVDYDPAAARQLSASLARLPGRVFEAHSTDYQPPTALRGLVADGFAILKVGPGLTFALREALYGLDLIAEELHPGTRARTLREQMEALMLSQPKDWSSYYHGTGPEQALQRHFSYSDRIRYYWPAEEARAAVAELMALLGEERLPEPLIAQYLGGLYRDMRAGLVKPTAPALVDAAIRRVIADYVSACGN